MKWEDVLARDDIVGGDLETQEDGIVYRGPIGSIELKDGKVIIVSPWTGRLNPAEGKWKVWNINTCSIDAEMSPPGEIGNGRISFNMPFLGIGVIFPKGGSKLDPAKIEGLDLSKIETS